MTQFCNYLPLEKGHIWTNLILFYPRMLSTQFDWNQISGSGKEDFSCPPIFSLRPFFVCKSTHAVNYHSWLNHYDHNYIENGIYMQGLRINRISSILMTCNCFELLKLQRYNVGWTFPKVKNWLWYWIYWPQNGVGGGQVKQWKVFISIRKLRWAKKGVKRV